MKGIAQIGKKAPRLRSAWLVSVVTCAVLGGSSAGVAMSQERSVEEAQTGGSGVGQEQEIEELAAFLLDLEEQRRKLLEVLSPDVKAKVLQRLEILADLRATLSGGTGEGTKGEASEGIDAAPGTETTASRGSNVSKPAEQVDAPEVSELEGAFIPVAVVEPGEDLGSTGAVKLKPEEATVDVAKSAPAESLLPGRRGARCEAWTIFDTNGDDELSGADRYWRHFSIWMDDGDGVPEESEMKDSFTLGLRKLSLDLRSYEGAKNTTGVVERRLNSGRERLRVEILKRVRGSNGAGYGFLAIDVAGLVRGEGPRIRRFDAKHPKGEILTSGFVPVEQGVEVEVVGRGGAGGSFAGEAVEGEAVEARWLPLLCARKGR